MAGVFTVLANDHAHVLLGGTQLDPNYSAFLKFAVGDLHGHEPAPGEALRRVRAAGHGDATRTTPARSPRAGAGSRCRP